MSVRILTANLWSGGADTDALIEVIERLRVDVACVQELSPRVADALALVLPEGRMGPDRRRRSRGLGRAMTSSPATVSSWNRSLWGALQ